MKKYIVRLTDGERQTLDNLVSTGKAAAYKIKHANILPQVDADGGLGPLVHVELAAGRREYPGPASARRTAKAGGRV